MPSTPATPTPTPPPRRILALPASLRKGSWNRRLLTAAAGIAPPDLEVRLHEGLGTLPLFDEDLEATADRDDPAPVRDLRSAVSAADGLLIATPEYNQSLPGVLKNGLDWLSRPYGEGVLMGKPVAVLGATSGAWGTRLAQKELRHVLWACEARVLPQPAVYVGRVASRFDTDGRADDALVTSLAGLLAAFREWIS